MWRKSVTKPSFIKRRKWLTYGVICVALLLAWLAIPKPDLYQQHTFSVAAVDRHGTLLRLALAEDDRYRLFTELAHIPPQFIEATLLYEDKYFRSHPGVNPIATLRAAWTTWVKRSRRMGASTITMQLARLRYSLNTRTLAGKLRQMAYALQIERHYSKDDILEAYLNLAPYGGNIEGIGAAAAVYFGKRPAQLTLPQLLTLAVIPQNPVRRSPHTVAGRAALHEARYRLLELWRQHNHLPDHQRELFELDIHVNAPDTLPYFAPHFSTHLLTNAKAGDQRNGTLNTTIDLPLQNRLQHALSRYVERRGNQGIRNASAMLLDHQTMEVVASIGSVEFFDPAIHGQVDGTRARRSPGSTLKPLVFGLAMDRGLIHPMSMMKDAPKRFGVYTPENFDRGFMGPVLARDALIYSRNVPAIELLNRVGQERFHKLLVDGGVSLDKPASWYGLASILGGNELTMEELVQLYAMLANGGRWQALRKKVDQPNAAAKQLMSPEASFLVLDMLRQASRPGALSIEAKPNAAVAWKTGTSYAHRDAWTIGVTDRYVLAVWVGNFDGTGNPALVGVKAAAPLFFNLLDQLPQQDAQLAYQAPPPTLNLRKVDMCVPTGDLPNRYCPQLQASWFIPGVSPIKVSNIFRPVTIDTRTGLRACPNLLAQAARIAADDHLELEEKIYAFWPSDLSTLMSQAGVSLRQPPDYSPECLDAQNASSAPDTPRPIDLTAHHGLAPQITSPAPVLTYQARLNQTNPLALTAITDADVTSLFWFVDDHFVAEVKRDEPLVWNARPGQFNVLVVDDLGRSQSQLLQVELVQ